MKLNPPGSSSDLQVARAIARRLHQRAFPQKALPGEPAPADAPRAEPASRPPAVEAAREPKPARPPVPMAEPAPERRLAPPPLPPRPTRPPVVEPAPAPEPRLRPEPVPPSVEDKEQAWSEPLPRRPRRDEAPAVRDWEPERPAREPWASQARESDSWEVEGEGDAEHDVDLEEPTPGADERGTAGGTEDVEDALADLAGDDTRLGGLAGRGPAPEVGEPEAERPSVEHPGIVTPGEDEPELDVGVPEASAYEPREHEGQPYEAPYEEPVPAGPDVSPEDLIGGGPPEAPESWAARSPLEDEIEAAVGGEGGPEDLLELAGPSWDDVAETCLGLAGARGSMLVEASGQVLAARGDWPNPGPEAIATRLVTMMERALRDAPTRSVSAPLAGQHLTAWRVPLAESLLTAVFIGDAALKADVRPPIDAEIRRAAG